MTITPSPDRLSRSTSPVNGEVINGLSIEGKPVQVRPLEAALERLKRFHPKAMDLSLGRMHRLLAALDHPERNLPPVFHVAGTNGKGSTLAFARAMLEAAGRRVHVYTSPHLVTFNERIRVAGSLIGDDALIALIDDVEAINNGEMITFFEITTAMAFYIFAHTPADAVLLETGLGGVMDATNVVGRPAVTAITRISFDHVHLLGGTLREIAGEKAGIMKAGVPNVLSFQRSPEPVDVARARARLIGAPFLAYGEAWRLVPGCKGFRYEDRDGAFDLPSPGLLGAHQIMNAGTAIAALRTGGFGVTRDAIAQGLQSVEWPGRLQRLTRGPLAALLPHGWELWLDGGHNDSGGEVLADQAAAWADMPLDIVYGMLTTKTPSEFLEPLAPHIARLRAVAIPGEELSMTAQASVEAARGCGIEAATAIDVVSAIQDLRATDEAPRRILICGSLYLAGVVLQTNQGSRPYG